MATLEKIRSMKYLLIGFVGFALLAFIIGDLFQGISSFRDDPNVMVKVDGETIGVEEFQNVFERYVDNERSRTADGTISDIRENQLRNTVINGLIQQKLLTILTENIGFKVGKEELTDLFLGDNISPVVQQYFMNPNTGALDKEAIRNYILYMAEDDSDIDDPQLAQQQAQNRQMWDELKEQVEQQQVYAKFSALLTASIDYNALDRKAHYENNKIKVDFDYVAKPFASIPDEGIEVTDAEIKQLYDKKKNLYKQSSESRVIDYIAVNVVPSQKDMETEKANLEEVKKQMENTVSVGALVSHNSMVPYKEGYRSYNSLTADEKRVVDNNEIGVVTDPVQNGNFFSMYKYEGKRTSPDSVTFNIIAIQLFDEAAIKTKADSLIQVLKSGTPFTEVSLAETQNRFNGEYGTHTEQSLLDAENHLFTADFKDALFNAPLNEPVLLSMGPKGSFIVQVTEKTKPVDKYKVASIRKEVRASKETRNDTYNQLSRFISSNKDLQAFRDSASAAGYSIVTDLTLTTESTSIRNIEDTRQIIQWAFNGKKGDISRIYETKNYDYLMVATLQDVYPEGAQPLQAVEESLRRELINEKKAEKILAEVNGKNFASLEQYAGVLGANPQTVHGVSFGMESNISGIGMEPVIYAEAPLAEVGKVAGPYKGKNAVYVLYVTDKQVNEQPYDDAAYKQQMEMQNSRRIQQLLNNPELLKSNVKIENNSINFPIYR